MPLPEAGTFSSEMYLQTQARALISNGADAAFFSALLLGWPNVKSSTRAHHGEHSSWQQHLNAGGGLI